MRIFKNIFSFYVNSSIHVAFAVVALVAVTKLQHRISFQEDLLLFVFFGTITAYNFVKYAGIARLHHRSLTINLKVIQIFSLGCFLAFIYYALQVPGNVLLLGLVLGFITLLYAIPVFNGGKNLRMIKGLKVHVISFIWAGATVLIPLIAYRTLLETGVALEFMQRYLLVLVLLFPFEIRDLKYDKIHLRTIPQRMGVRRTKRYGLLLLVVFVVAEVLKITATTASLVAVTVVAILTGAIIQKSDQNQSKYFASFWVEGVPVLWFLLLWILKMGI